MTKTGWIDDIFHDFMLDSTYHLEENLPHLSEVIAEESEQLCHKEKQKLIEEFLEKINGYLDTDINDAIRYFLKVRVEYKKRLKS